MVIELPKKQGRRECEVCERRVTNLAIDPDGELRGDCPVDGRVPAWITGVRQNRIEELEQALERAALRGAR